MLGTTISHYRVLQRLGGGGMGVVYEAEDLRLGRSVALKFLPAEVAADPAALERLYREARAASALNHPNICTIYDVDRDGERPFIAMEHIEGQSLADKIAGKPLPAEELRELGTQIAGALAAAHAKGILHRDLKPANILVTESGQAKLLDFGLAKQLSQAVAAGGETALTEAGQTPGTLVYMSPEQALGKTLDARTDLFSFGVVLYEMATGKLPFTGESPGAVYDAILHVTPAAPAQLNPQIPPDVAQIIAKALEKDRELRYQGAAEIKADLQRLKRPSQASASAAPVAVPQPGWLARHWNWKRMSAMLAALVVVAAATFFYTRPRAHALSDQDEILLADFVNTTGEEIFDGTLKTAIAVKLGESPFLNTVSDTRVRDTLKLMQKPAEEKLVAAVARETCERLNAKALLNSSIARLGSEYVITLEAQNCLTGETLAREQAEASGRGEVLKSLGQATTKLRGKLGESLKSIQGFDTPLYEATTSSLEALKAFSLGWGQQMKSNYPAAIAFYERAIELDPNFALAYQRLGISYANMGQSERSRANYERAFQLRQRASERERYLISSQSYVMFTGEVNKAVTMCQLHQQSYPRDPSVYLTLGGIYREFLGLPERALEQDRKALGLAPTPVAYRSVAADLRSLNRYDEAAEVWQHVIDGKLIGEHYYAQLYQLAFVRGDRAGMERWAAETKGTPAETSVVYQQAEVNAFNGRLRKARKLYEEAAKLALRADRKPYANVWLDEQALVEAEFGNPALARTILAESRSRSPVAGLVWARSGNAATAQSIADEIAKRWPVGTVAQEITVPMIRAAIALQRGEAGKSVELLRPTMAHDLAIGWGSSHATMYLRGCAHLKAGQAAEAAAVFQKLLDHRGVDPTSPLYALAYAGMARARALTGDVAGARRAYDEFFTLWKDADPDIPILQQAKTEYAKLK